jgi:arsenate reductase (glutaredoxin)
LAKRQVAIYGIKNCDTMKKARKWLDDRKIGYVFYDYKAEGIDRARLEGWSKAVSWETLLNRSGATFRALPDSAKEGLTKAKAISLMLEQPSMIKRPVLDVDGRLLVGFKAEAYEAALK